MRYFIGFLVSVGLIVLVVVLIIRGLSGGKETKTAQAPLSDYASTSSIVQLTVAGPIVGDSQFQSYKITVGRDQAGIITRQGYESNIIDQRTYSNNQEGYTNFLRALDVAGFTKGDPKSPNKDERGMCSAGDRFVMQIVNGSSDVQRYWSTNCSRLGNFKGDSDEVRRLFNNQIPTADFSKLTSNLRL